MLRKTSICLFFLSVIYSFSLAQHEQNRMIEADFKRAELQYADLLKVSKDLTQYPRTTAKDGTLRYTDIGDWTGGFWPGALWYVYEYTKKEEWKNAALKWTESLEKNQFNATHHDIGFMMYCSYGNAIRFVKNDQYRDILIQSAKTLCTRYHEQTGVIKSWNNKLSWDGKTLWRYPVIMDNMMNLELLFYATQVTGDTMYRHIAIRHAENTMRNHVRADYSSYHVVDYDSATGKVLHQETNQGYANNSTWSRGQAWGIYGFTMVYRHTKDKRFLTTAQKMADFFIDHSNLPSDKIPFWDFNALQEGYTPGLNSKAPMIKTIPRDASAASITASALFELSGYLGKAGGKKYYDAAVSMLKSLSSDQYLAKAGTNNYFLLKHCVGSIPHGSEIDVPLIYADYYFLEALLKWKQSLKS